MDLEHEHPGIRIVIVSTTTLEEQLGLWCEHCMLPSRYRGVYATTLEGTPLCVAELEGCTECGD